MPAPGNVPGPAAVYLKVFGPTQSDENPGASRRRGVHNPLPTLVGTFLYGPRARGFVALRASKLENSSTNLHNFLS